MHLFLIFKIFLCIFISKSEAIHNKDYSVVKTFRAALNGVVLFFLQCEFNFFLKKQKSPQMKASLYLAYNGNQALHDSSRCVKN
jgi:hypothetical protein